MITITGETNSGIQFFKWTHQFLFSLTRQGLADGLAFQQKNEKQALAADYKAKIFGKLEVVQATSNLIDPGMKYLG